jgi:predicted TIM-barrel fold metal-dependent hydrolase
VPKKTIDIIDPHLHLFDLAQGDYHWLKPENPPHWHDKHLIQHNFDQQDLILHSPFNLSGFVHIEAGFDNITPENEIIFLQNTINKLPFKAIAFTDITLAPALFAAQIKQLQQQTAFIGIRHITEGQDAEQLFNSNVSTNFRLLAKHNLIFEAQFELTNLAATEQLISLAKHTPELTIVINHAGFVTQAHYPLWQSAIQKLAPYNNLIIKCSGWEMQDRHYQTDWLKTVISWLMTQVSNERIMLASNFPLCQFHCHYHHLWSSYYQLNLTTDSWHKISFANANKIYQLNI